MDEDIRIAVYELQQRVAALEAQVAALGSGNPALVDSAPGWSEREFATGDDPEVVEALRSGSKIEAIKLFRVSTGLGLAEAKHAVEEIERRLGL